MSVLLQQFHASNPVGEQRAITLELAHSAIVTTLSAQVDSAGYLRLAQSFYDLTCAVDTASPPATATFHASGFGFRLPARNTDGHQDLNFQIDNVSRDAWLIIKAVQAATRTSAERAIMTLRVFLMSDLTTIEASYPFTCKTFNVTRDRVLVTGTFHDLVNRRFPRLIYTPESYPGATYL